MDTLINLAVMVLSELQVAPERKYAGVRRMVAAAVIAALAVVVAAGALGCAVAAFWIYLSSVDGPLAAAIGSTAALLFIGVVLTLLARSLFQEEPRTDVVKNVLRDEILHGIHRGFDRNKGAALLAALIAGVVAGSTTRGK